MEPIRSEFECEAAGAAQVTFFRVVESLSQPFEATIELELEDPDADVTVMLGENAGLTIERAPAVRRVRGVICEVWEGHGHEGRGETQSQAARVRVVPAFKLIHLRRNTRMFQEMSAPEILEDLLSESLGAYGRKVSNALDGTYLTREYCLQYQETDYDFAHRLMEEEGIFYAFDHAGDVETMVLYDRGSSCPRVESPSDPIEHNPQNLLARDDREVVHVVDRSHRHSATSVATHDWDWTAAGDMRVDGAEEGEDLNGFVRESYEHGVGRSLQIVDYDAGARRYQANAADAQPASRLEAHAAENVVIEGIGRVLGFQPGATFELINHPLIGFDDEYILTRSVHESAPAEGVGDDAGAAEPYHNEFEAIPLKTAYRPPRLTPKPRVRGIQTATVTGPAGEEIHVDEHGRIKVQFFWDRENPADETSSCWVRCEQDWAGPGWGFWWVPRIGMEVVVQFVDGDPDRPVVTGCVYNGANALPYPMPDEKTKSTIKSNSSIGGGGSNELRFEDKAGEEEIYAHAQKDYDEVVENDHSTLVHHDQTNEVDNDQVQTVHNNQTERVDVDQTMSIGNNRSVHVEGNFDETVDGTETRNVGGDVTETFSANETRTVAADVTEDIGTSETRTVGGNQTETIGGTHAWDIAASSALTVTGSMTQTVTGGITSNTPAAETLIAVAGMNVAVAGATTWSAQAGVTFIAPGGFTFIDNSNDWMGQYLVKFTPWDKAVIGAKIEIGGTATGFVTFKAEAHWMCLNLHASFEENDGAFIAGTPLDADTGTKLNFIGVTFEG
ncbi:MAG: type VI secretion system Vgr family protein [Sandaracinaceae bacterium]